MRRGNCSFFERDFLFATGFFEVLLAFLKAGGLPGFDGTAGQREAAIRKGKRLVDFNDSSETAAGGAGSEGMVEGKKGRGGFVKIPFVSGAVVPVGIEVEVDGILREGDGDYTLAVAEA